MKVVIGAGQSYHPGWLCLTERQLDITDRVAWERLFRPASIDAILSEHVLEHLTENEAEKAIENFRLFLKHGGYVKIAVPDGYHPSKNYINYVAPGTWMTPFGADHKQLFNVDSLCALLERHGFKVDPIEGFTARREWFSKQSEREGRITKRPGEFQALWQSFFSFSNYTSLIVDGTKP